MRIFGKILMIQMRKKMMKQMKKMIKKKQMSIKKKIIYQRKFRKINNNKVKKP